MVGISVMTYHTVFRRSHSRKRPPRRSSISSSIHELTNRCFPKASAEAVASSFAWFAAPGANSVSSGVAVGVASAAGEASRFGSLRLFSVSGFGREEGRILFFNASWCAREDRMRSRNILLPGCSIMSLPCRKRTSFDRGQSTGSGKVFGLVPPPPPPTEPAIPPPSNKCRVLSHCEWCLVVIVPDSVIGTSSTGIPYPLSR
mmetsp:Transcript_5850/g.12323  ORF Transcript_5850/g.12323 Transcript_5850/m.12323 type:complete len:202 (-) Transcript_5850:1056-1661(-)